MKLLLLAALMLVACAAPPKVNVVKEPLPPDLVEVLQKVGASYTTNTGHTRKIVSIQRWQDRLDIVWLTFEDGVEIGVHRSRWDEIR